MSYEINYDEEQRRIDVTFTGKVTMPVVREYIATLLPILEETQCSRLLSDCLNAEIQLTSMDIMQFPKLAEQSPLTARLKRAVLVTPGTSGYELYETLSNIQGQNVKAFSDRAEALRWLMAD
jgi:hypothetical protein